MVDIDLWKFYVGGSPSHALMQRRNRECSNRTCGMADNNKPKLGRRRPRGERLAVRADRDVAASRSALAYRQSASERAGAGPDR